MDNTESKQVVTVKVMIIEIEGRGVKKSALFPKQGRVLKKCG